MALKITANSLFLARSLSIDSSGVVFQETAGIGGKHRFKFEEIDCILMSADHVLSIQVGQDVFSIPTKPHERKHQEVISTMVGRVRSGPTERQ